MAFLEELKQKAQKMRPALDAKYAPDAPVAWDINRKDRSQRFNEDFRLQLDTLGVTLTLKQQDDAQDVGSCVWTAAIAFSKFLEHHYGNSLQGRRCIELGSGTGLVGITAAALGAEVVLTDLEHIVARLRENVSLNSSPMDGDADGWRCTAAGGRVRADELMWGHTDLQQFLPPYDIVLACEVIYEADLVGPLLQTLRCCSSPESTVLLHIFLAYNPETNQ